MRLLITGSGGFIGGSVGRLAARTGHTVLGLARASQPSQGWPGAHLPIDVAQADLKDAIVEFAPDAILHAAGSASVSSSLAAPLDDLRAAAMTWANLLDAVRRSGTRPLILFPSSAAVYGNPACLPISEAAAPAPISPYGFHKTACELLAREYAECFGLRILVARVFSVFGPAQRRLLVWELFRQASEPGSVIWLQGTGRESRDYLSIGDLATALLSLAQRNLLCEPGGPCIFNMASGVEVSVMDVAERVRELIAPHKPVQCRGVPQDGDPTRWRADVARLRRLIPEWQPVPFAESISHCLDTWRHEVDADAPEQL